MTRLAWISDPHLNHCDLHAWDRLIVQVDAARCDAVVISGDISEGEDVVFQLRRLADAVNVPIYFVLGNHDFYHSSFRRTLAAVRHAARRDPRIRYLPDLPPVPIGPRAVMIGVNGWGDATRGDYERSPVRLNDFRLIDDFYSAPESSWRTMLGELGKAEAELLHNKLAEALSDADRVLVVTHVPPFRRACWYQGRVTDDLWAPFFVCGSCGEVLEAAAAANPHVSLQVICGHTHGAGVAEIESNLAVTTAEAEYGRPVVTAVIRWDGDNCELIPPGGF